VMRVFTTRRSSVWRSLVIKAALFHAVEKARNVRVVRNHAVADGTASQAFGLGPRRMRRTCIERSEFPRFQELFSFPGAEPEGLACRAIGDRMISHDPDITRLSTAWKSAA